MLSSTPCNNFYRSYIVLLCCLLAEASINLLKVGCNDLKRDITGDDITKVFGRYTKRYTGTVRFIANTFSQLALVGEYPSGISSCRMDPLPPITRSIGWIPVAVGPHDYIHSLMCGACLKISPRARKKRTIAEIENRSSLKAMNAEFVYDPTQPYYATIVDQCPHCKPENSAQPYYATIVDQCPHCKPGDIEMYREGKGEKNDIIYEAIDCTEIPGEEGHIRTRIKKCKNDEGKKIIQIKNTKLPTLSLEIFQDERWKCAKRTTDNHFILSLPNNSNSYILPIKARATTVTGQSIGFTITSLELKKDYIIPAQYTPFETISPQKPPKLKCSIEDKQTNREVDDDKDVYDLKKRNMTLNDLHKLPNNLHLLTPSGHLIKKETDTKMDAYLTARPNHIINKTPFLSSVLSNFNAVNNRTIFFVNNKLNRVINRNSYPWKTNFSTSLQRPSRPHMINLVSLLSLKKNNNNLMANTNFQNASKQTTLPNRFVNHILQAGNKTNFVQSQPCLDKPDGRYRASNDCSAFYICQKGKELYRKCPKGLMFNSIETVCDWPNHVKCNPLNFGNVVTNSFDENEVYTKKFSS